VAMDEVEIANRHVEHWQEHGYVVLERFVSGPELAEAQAEFRSYFPTWDEYVEAPRRYQWINDGPIRHFPFDGHALNEIVVHPALTELVERLLGTSEILLSQAILVAKYSGAGNDEDQPLHVDFDDNSLLYPTSDGRYEQIPMIVYLSDVTADLSPTFVVSRRNTEGRFLVPTAVLARRDGALYEHEVPILAPAGSVFVHSMRTFHRGSSFRGEGNRFAIHLTYRYALGHWMGWSLWARQANQPAMIRFLETASVRQRELLGFPPLGHDYWSEETVAGVAARYPGMDVTPYLNALSAPESH
jgi:ectoine hydroxylase-related dioxygenase (phytanoyl-CoA dioxygenase family)